MPSKKTTFGARRACLILAVLALVVSLAFVGVGSAWNETAESSEAGKIAAKGPAALVRSFDKVEKEEFSWGWIRWLMNSKLRTPRPQMTFGVVQLKAGQINPFHGSCQLRRAAVTCFPDRASIGSARRPSCSRRVT